MLRLANNLNYSAFDVADSDDQDVLFADYGYKGLNVDVFFKNIKKHLCRYISSYELVVGCVAWLTDVDILNSLAKTDASIIVQKEDFLRPDSCQINKNCLYELYSKIDSRCERWNFTNTILPKLTYAGDPCLGGIRCVGNYNREKNPAHPRMHHKFLVFCRREEHKQSGSLAIIPEAVWTGSFNFTNNSGNSLENAIVIHDSLVAQAYLKEFAQVAAISEPLNWESEWIAPEWRIGS